jgi:hypothetical protein
LTARTIGLQLRTCATAAVPSRAAKQMWESEMHLQNRVTPSLSPADVGKVLKLLADNHYNIIAAGGSNIEQGGEFAFAVDDEGVNKNKPQEAHDLLRSHKYNVRLIEVPHCIVANSPGELQKCVEAKVAENPGKKIKDFAIGPQPDGAVLVQIYFE